MSVSATLGECGPSWASNDHGSQRLKMRMVANGIEIGLVLHVIAIFGLQVECLREIGHGQLDVAGQAPVASQVVMRNTR